MSYVPPLRRLLTRLLIALLIVMFIGYGLFEGRKLIAGPQISIEEPHDGATLGGPDITIAGSAQNIAFFSVNGKQAFIDGSGRFQETLSPPSGYTILTVSGRDRFGRTTTKSVRIIISDYCPAYAES